MSLIGDALRRAEHDSRPRHSVAAGTSTRGDRTDGQESAAIETGAWVASKGRDQRRPSISSLIILALSAATLWVLAEPNWGKGLLTVIPGVEPNDAVTAKPSQAVMGVGPAIAGVPDGRHGTAESVDSAPIVEPSVAAPIDPDAGGDTTPGPTATPREVPPAPRPLSGVRSLRVEGVMIGGASALAVVNGTIVKVGQTVDGARIIAVTRTGVSVEVDGETHHLPVQGGASAR